MPAEPRPRAHHDVVVVGAGQAGLSVSHELVRHGVDHVVLDRHGVAHAWREQRWDSFCLVTPNWQCDLPGWPYRGDDPDGFMVKDDVVAYVEGYAASFGAPVVAGVEATGLVPAAGGGFDLETSDGPVHADAVVVATGAYHRPVVPRTAERVPERVVQTTVDRYRGPGDLPPGEVLVVGSGQSGAQVAEDLHLAGRRVHLSVGTAPRVARRYRGRDVVAWLHDMGHYDITVDEHPLGRAAAERTNHYVTGRDGGRDIDLRAFARDGMRLYGRLREVTAAARAVFDDDLAHNLDAADAVSEGIKDAVDAWVARTGLPVATEERRGPVWRPPADAPRELDLSAVSAVVWCTGFAADDRWVGLPAFDGRGRWVHQRGVTPVDGLYVVGLPWLHTWGSGRFSGVGRDAVHVAGAVRAHLAAVRPARAG